MATKWRHAKRKKRNRKVGGERNKLGSNSVFLGPFTLLDAPTWGVRMIGLGFASRQEARAGKAGHPGGWIVGTHGSHPFEFWKAFGVGEGIASKAGLPICSRPARHGTRVPSMAGWGGAHSVGDVPELSPCSVDPMRSWRAWSTRRG